MRKNKGVTISSLVITIIILLIIAGISISVGNISITAYQDNILEAEAKELQTVVISQYQKYLTVKDATLLVGKKCDDNGNVTEDGEYYLLNKNDLQEIGMEKPKDEYIVKYDTGEVINKTTPKNSKGENIHLKGN